MTDLFFGAVTLIVLCIPIGALFAGLYWLVDAIDRRLFLARLKREGKL